MIKAKLIRLVEEMFTGVNATADGRNKYHPLYIEQFFIPAFADLMKIFHKDMSNFDQYCKIFPDIAILYDAATDMYYSILPVSVLQLPDSAKGVRRVSGMQNNRTVQFIALKRDSWDIWGLNNVAATSTEIGYSVMIDRVEYFRNPEIPSNKVKMYLCPTFDSYKMADDIPIPSGSASQLFAIMQGMMQGQRPSDKINNNLPN